MTSMPGSRLDELPPAHAKEYLPMHPQKLNVPESESPSQGSPSWEKLDT